MANEFDNARMNDICIVTARAKDRTGREDESTGAVPLGNLRGDALANALMKCETELDFCPFGAGGNRSFMVQ
jgi:hypothetical protein